MLAGIFGSNDADVIIPILGMFFVFGTPLIAILLHHQRKMAETLRGSAQGQVDVNQLTASLHHLSQLVHQNTIAIDDIRHRLDGLAAIAASATPELPKEIANPPFTPSPSTFSPSEDLPLDETVIQ